MEEKKEQYKMNTPKMIILNGKDMALAETLINEGLAKDFNDLIKKALYFISTKFDLSQKEFKDIEKKFLEEQIDLMEKGEDEKAEIKAIEYEMHFGDPEKVREMLNDKMLFRIFKVICKNKKI